MTTDTMQGLGIRESAIRQVAPDVIFLQSYFVNLCLVGTGSGLARTWVLVDAGLANSADDILSTAEEYFDSSKPEAVVLTHGHFDHVVGLGVLLSHWDVPVFAHAEEIPYLTGEKEYPPGDPTADPGIVAQLSPLFPNRVINIANRVQPLPTDGRIPFMPGWRWIATPGHTPGHISLFRESDRVLIAGDAFTTVRQESLAEVITQHQEVHGPPAYFTMDWHQAWDSIKKLAELKPSLVIAGHGQPMSGEKLTRELERLARDYGLLVVPQR